MEREKEALNKEIENLKNEINNLEKQIGSLRTINDEFEAKLKTQQAKQLALENDFSSGQKEMTILIELNERLQRERQEIQKYIIKFYLVVVHPIPA